MASKLIVPTIPFSRIKQRVSKYADPFTYNPHQAFYAQSRSGKSFMIRHGILPIYGASRIVVMDVKPGGERTWNGYGNPVTELSPGFGIGPDGTPHYHLLLRDKASAERFLKMIAAEGSCVVVIDDSRRVTASAPDWGLSGYVDNLMTIGAAYGVTVLICANSTVWSTSSLRDQTGINWIGRVTNEDERKKIIRYTGNTKELNSILASLPPRHFLYSDNYSGDARLAITTFDDMPEG
jgi:hypothetical protein